ncbi:MAG: hypothetical protein U1E73_07660 [Planctomycetota bacterium]
MTTTSRRRFLGSIGNGMLMAGLGPSLCRQLGIGPPAIAGTGAASTGDDLEPWIARMQESSADELLPHLVRGLRTGTGLDAFATAGAIANARTFGAGDYEGYHAFMALLPALAMAARLPAAEAPLPVLKVLHRNTARIRKAGAGRTALPPIAVADAAAPVAPTAAGATLRQQVRDRDLAAAESLFARRCAADPAVAADDLQWIVRDDLNVHRIVLAWRAFDMLRIAGREHAEILMRQVVRFCVDEERNRIDKGRPAPAVREDVPRILDHHGLFLPRMGERRPDDAWVDALAHIVFSGDPASAAEAVAQAIADGFLPDAIAEAISLAANRLLRHDTGERRVHGASVGVHASDAANAWRHVAAVGAPATRAASLVVAAYHTAGQSLAVGKEPYAFDEARERLAAVTDAEALLRAARSGIEARDQRAAMAAIDRYGALGHDARAAMDLMLGYAVSEDGALHAEKYFQTACEEFAASRPAFRWRHLVGLARVTASEFGEPAPGVAAARELMKS